MVMPKTTKTAKTDSSKKHSIIGGGTPSHTFFVTNARDTLTCECGERFSNLTLLGLHVKARKEDMSTATQNSKSKNEDTLPMHAMPSGGEMDVPCHLIDADPKFNARHFLDGTGKDGQTVEQLANTIKKEGQLSAVQVRPGKDGRFDLVFGFRRFAAISWPKEKGGLGLPTIKATIADPELTEKDLYYRNLTENVARENLTPYDLGLRCKLLKEEGDSGAEIAKRIGKNTGYINDLIRYATELHPEIMQRWKLEHSPEFDANQTKVLTTDNLRQICAFKKDDGKTPDKDAQLKAYHDLMVTNGNEEGDKDDDKGDGNGAGNARGTAIGAKRPSLKHLKSALEAAEMTKKHGKDWSLDKEGKVKGGKALDKEETTRINAIIETLQWAMASKIKPGQTNSIKGVYSYKDGE
jgi:ParB/RepB/Spo0J family partition protein